MKKRNATDQEIPGTLAAHLNEHFLQTLYFRFEFARGAITEPAAFEVFEADQNGRPRFFKRIHQRRVFLDEGPGRQSYLSDLRADIDDAGQEKEEAKRRLRDYVEGTSCPLTFCESVTNYSEPQAEFFRIPWTPKQKCESENASKTQEKKRKASPSNEARALTRHYCFELFELQDYLHNEIGVKPGSLLPVWVSSDGKPDHPVTYTDMPTFSFLPVAQTTVGVLVQYLTWEYGSDTGEWFSKIHTIPEGPKKGQQLTLNAQVLRRTLLWGRRFLCREVKIMSLSEGTNISFAEFAALPHEQRLRVLRDADRRVADGDVRRSFLKDLTHSPEAERLLGVIKGLRDDVEDLDLVNHPLHMERVDIKGGRESAIARSKHLYEKLDTALPLAEYFYLWGGYRELW